MTTQATGMLLDATRRIPVFGPWRRVNAELLDLLATFGAEDWSRPTVHPERDVKDLTAHLLHGSLRRVASLRDGYTPEVQPLSGFEELVAFIQRDNREFMTGMRRLSPRILVELIATYDPQVLSLLEALSPDAPGLGVAWAGETISCNWFDAAREYTEKWHHQQQLRDATARPPLYDPELLAPVLETFARGLPFAYRAYERAEGASVAISITGAVDLHWTLRRAGGAWALWSGGDAAAESRICIPADITWRLWTRGSSADNARPSIKVAGDERAVEPLLRYVAVMA